VKGDLRVLAKAIRLSRATMRNIRQNLFFAFLYNALGIPVAAAVYPEKPHYSDWYDTAEAQAVLDYQHTPFPRFLEMLEQAVAEALA